MAAKPDSSAARPVSDGSSSIQAIYLQEQLDWENLVSRALGAGAGLLHVSVFSSDCRIYKTAGSVFKVRKITPASTRGRINSLADEFELLSGLAAVEGVPAARVYRRDGDWEILEMEELPGLPARDPTTQRKREPLGDFWRVVRATTGLNRRGCSHGDLHALNAGRNIEGELSLFDFDQAVMAHPFRCILRDFLGIGIDDRRSACSLLKRACRVQGIGTILWLPVVLRRRVLRLVRRIPSGRERKGFAPGSKRLPRPSLQNPHSRQELLARAWAIAARSNASSPGAAMAYYSLDIAGTNYPGERPWMLRWTRIRNTVNFAGKRLLELGCNMGLLSIHARLAGASGCLGIDIDEDILDAARHAARAFEVDVAFQRLDLEDDACWEEELSGFDIVCALSVMHWVEDKDRVWSFLSRQREVLYEGHEPENEVTDRFMQAGFTRIARLGTSERNRQLFYAVKQEDA